MDRERLQQRLGRSFSKPELLSQALTHRSHGNPHNERLEFLGDGVLNCVIAAALFERFPRAKEGDLSRMRASLVRQESLARLAQDLGIGDMLKLGEGELKSGGFSRPSILADALEAVFGALFLDGGFDAARDAINVLYAPSLAALDPKAVDKDSKTLLQELLQSRRIALPKYTVVATAGAAHDQRFEVECLVPELDVRTSGSGTSRRIAEQEAALRACEAIQARHKT
jgi:ribonuclease-3